MISLGANADGQSEHAFDDSVKIHALRAWSEFNGFAC
jgi:hypothetical protein